MTLPCCSHKYTCLIIVMIFYLDDVITLSIEEIDIISSVCSKRYLALAIIPPTVLPPSAHLSSYDLFGWQENSPHPPSPSFTPYTPILSALATFSDSRADTDHEKVSAEDVNDPRPKLLCPLAQAWPRPRRTGVASSWEQLQPKRRQGGRGWSLNQGKVRPCVTTY